MYSIFTGRETRIQHKKMDKKLQSSTSRKDFEKDDIVRIFDHEGNQIGVGRIGYNSEKARSLIGKQGARPLIHYDYLYLD